MIRFVDNSDNIVKFKYVVEGNAFMFQGSHFIKVYDSSENNNALCLETGTMDYFNDDDKVVEIDLDIIVKEVVR